MPICTHNCVRRNSFLLIVVFGIQVIWILFLFVFFFNLSYPNNRHFLATGLEYRKNKHNSPRFYSSVRRIQRDETFISVQAGELQRGNNLSIRAQEKV